MTPEEINVVDLKFEFKDQRTMGNMFTSDYTNSVKSGNVKWILGKKRRTKNGSEKKKK